MIFEDNKHKEYAPIIAAGIQSIQNDINEYSNIVSGSRSSYQVIFDKRAKIQNALNLFASINDLEKRREDILAPKQQEQHVESLKVELSESTLDKFSQLYEEILSDWNFPDANRIHFDKQTRDFVIHGKLRSSRGKGMRAITHAGFTITLLMYARHYLKSHLGFVVLDTPLLAYREPEGEDDDLSGTDVHQRFYTYLANIKDRQVIILENVDPPNTIASKSSLTFFSKNIHLGRYGFFPYSS